MNTTEWGYTAHTDEHNNHFVIFAKIQGGKATPEEQQELLQYTDNADSPVTNAYIVNEETLEKLDEAGFVRDHEKAVKMMNFYKDEGFLIKEFKPTEWAFSIVHEYSDTPAIAFTKIGTDPFTTPMNDQEHQEIADIIECKERFQNVFDCTQDVQILSTLLQQKGFTKDHQDAKDFVQKCLDNNLIEDIVIDVNTMIGGELSLNEEEEEEEEQRPRKSLSEIMAEQATQDIEKCPKCGSTTFINSNAPLGRKVKRNDSITKVCASCLTPIVDEDMTDMVQQLEESREKIQSFFYDNEFLIQTPDGETGPASKIIPESFIKQNHDYCSCKTNSDIETTIKHKTKEGLYVVQITIPQREYVDEDDNTIAKWDTKIFMTVGTIERDEDYYFKAIFLGEENPNIKPIDPDTISDPIHPLTFNADKFIATVQNGIPEIQNTSIIAKAKFRSMGNINSNRKVDELPVTTGSSWYIIDCVTHTGEPIPIITDGECYYQIRENDQGQTEIHATRNLDYGFGVNDKELINTVIDHINMNNITPAQSEEEWYQGLQ